jgi:hypothetical protein
MSEQPLNSLDRFRKRSARLVLEEHAVGCGGIVLRWRNPNAAVPVSLHVYSPGNATVFLDGAEVVNTGVDLAPGPHLLGMVIDKVDPAGGLLLCALGHTVEHTTRKSPTEVVEGSWWVVSGPDGTWRATLEEPPAEWLRLDFDDTSWAGLVNRQPTPEVSWRNVGSYHIHWCQQHGATFLALPPGARRGTVRARKRFLVPAPEKS